MASLFLRLLSMSMIASIVMLVVLIFRLFMRRAPRTLVCLLWIVVAVRLVLPFSLQSKYSLIPTKVASEVSAVTTLDEARVIFSSESKVNESEPSSFSLKAFVNEKRDTLATVWFVGFLLMFSYLTISSINLRLKVRDSVKTGKDIYVGDGVVTPFVLGLIMPRIYLSSSLREKDANYAVMHERAHLKRRDNIWKFLGYLLLSIYWFNPIVWMSFIAFSRDIELACDEKVISTMNVEDKKAYASALLSCCTQRRAIFSYPLCFGDIGIKERIVAMKNYKKPTIGAIILTSLICLSVAGCLLTDPEENSETKVVVKASIETSVESSEDNGSHELDTGEYNDISIVRLDDAVNLYEIELKSGETMFFIQDEEGVQHAFIASGDIDDFCLQQIIGTMNDTLLETEADGSKYTIKYSNGEE